MEKSPSSAISIMNRCSSQNGTGDLAVMSNAEYERLSGKCELYRMLDVGLVDAESGKSRKTEDTFSDTERKYGLGKV